MRAHEFITTLLEYKQDLTINKFGPAILSLVKSQNHPDNRLAKTNPKFYDKNTDQWNDTALLDFVFSKLESADPTLKDGAGGIYMPWIAREFAKGNIRRIEDLDSRVKPTLANYHKYKNKKDFWENNPEIKDIMRNTWSTLEDYTQGYQPVEPVKNRGTAKTVYEDDTVRIVHPEDEEAACYYGQGTKWCTAATQGDNMFNVYNKRGPMYILLPKSPEYTGEKYQLHFRTSQFMNEQDEPINIGELLNERFPGALEFFKNKYPEIKKYVAFASDEDIKIYLKMAIKRAIEELTDYVDDLKSDSSYSYFYEWQIEGAKKKGYFVPEFDREAYENGDIEAGVEDIDWDAVYNDDNLNDIYQFDPRLKSIKESIKDILRVPTEEIRDYFKDEPEEDVVDVAKFAEWYMRNYVDFHDFDKLQKYVLHGVTR